MNPTEQIGECPECSGSYEDLDVLDPMWISCRTCKVRSHQDCVGISVPIGMAFEWTCRTCFASTNSRTKTSRNSPMPENDPVTKKDLDEVKFTLKTLQEALTSALGPHADNKSSTGSIYSGSSTKTVIDEKNTPLYWNSRKFVERKAELFTPVRQVNLDKEFPQKIPQRKIDFKEKEETFSDVKADLAEQIRQKEEVKLREELRVEREKRMNAERELSRNRHPNDGQNRPPPLPPFNNQLHDDMSSLIKLMHQKQLESLPEFHGGPESESLWSNFHSAYRDTEKFFSPHENLRRLRMSIKGEALKTVRHDMWHPNSLAGIIEDLNAEYGRSDRVLKRTIAKLRSLPSPNMRNVSSVKSFRTELLGCFATLTGLRAFTYLDNPTNVEDVVALFPLELRIKWRQHAQNKLGLQFGQAVLEDLVNWFSDESRWVLLEADDEQSSRGSAKSESRFRNRMYMHEDPDDQNEPPSVPPLEPPKKINCIYCHNEGHKLEVCSSFVKLPLQKRWDFAKKKVLCFICLHRIHKKECPAKKPCGEDKCEKFHHKLLHRKEEQETPLEMNATCNNGSSNTTYFRIVPVKISWNGMEVETNAFFDEGSSVSMITDDIASQLNLIGTKDPLCLSWTDNTVKRVEESRRVDVSISGVGKNDKKFYLKNVRTIPSRNLDLPAPNNQWEEIKSLPHLNDLPFKPPFGCKPGILIGLEHSKLGLMFDVRQGTWNQPVASKTLLGWVIHGKQKQADEAKGGKNHRSMVVCECGNEEEIEKIVDNYFSTKNFGIRAAVHVEAKDDQRAREILENTTRMIDSQFETGLLWRSENIKLPDSLPMAKKRFACLTAQMLKDPELGKIIQGKIDEIVGKGFVRKLSEAEAIKRSDTTWYLPIFAVRNPHKPRKARLVYDAAAKVGEVSLNSMLLTGPDLLKFIVGILWRVRQGNIAVAGDIQDMYHRILITQKDQDSQRFLWRNKEETREPDTYVLQVMSFGATCSPASAQFVKNKCAISYETSHPQACKAITENMYVDDWLDSFNDELVAKQTCLDVRQILKSGGFVMRNWVSNSLNIMQELNGNNHKIVEISLDIESENLEKILGLYWDVLEDAYTFKLSFVRVDPEIVLLKRVPTKREVLKVVMAVYDPLGFTSPILVHGKILLQEIWRRGVKWDSMIAADLFEKWKKWMQSLKLIETIRIPRCYFDDSAADREIELHVFGDASEQAFAAVCYFRILSSSGVKVSFVGSKNKVAPKKHLSIPRLELQAAVLATRLAYVIQKEHSIQIARRFFWSDSQTVLSWIQSDHRKYKQFVANRVSEILDSSTQLEWHWISGKKNVADIATKEQSNLDLTKEGFWFGGPEFLRLPSSDWPVHDSWKNSDDKNSECLEELRAKPVCVVKEQGDRFSTVELSRFSKWNILIRAVGWVFRFIRIARVKCQLSRQKRSALIDLPQSELYLHVSQLSAQELADAEVYVLKKAQWELFSKEIESLSIKKPLPEDSTLARLSPYIDEKSGLLKMKGRIDATPFVSEDFKRPVILSRHHAVTSLLIKAYHERFFHQTGETVVNEIRQKFWIPQLRAATKLCIRNCQRCKNLRAVPQVPEESPLPSERLAIYERPFTYVGMDFFGPLIVTVGRRHEKRYGVIFTCLTVRAVYIELTCSLDTSSCVMAIRNFMCRFGRPKLFWSDNGTNLHGAESELRQALQNLDIQSMQTKCNTTLPGDIKTEWKFNTPKASHMGGVWERQIRSIKSVLYAILKEKAPKEELLRNLLIEAENVVNSRPLTYQPIDPDTQEAITPFHLLRQARIVYPQASFENEEFGKKTWRYSQQLADMFWKRFVREYLPELTKRTKWYSDQNPVKEGDVVIICESMERPDPHQFAQRQPSENGQLQNLQFLTFSSKRIIW